MNKTITFTQLLLSTLLAAVIGCGQPSEPVFREQDRVRIAEAFKKTVVLIVMLVLLDL